MKGTPATTTITAIADTATMIMTLEIGMILKTAVMMKMRVILKTTEYVRSSNVFTEFVKTNGSWSKCKSMINYCTRTR